MKWRRSDPESHLCRAYETARGIASISYAVLRIFGGNSPQHELTVESNMAHFLTGDEKCRDLIYDDDYRSYLMARSQSADGYRFGRIHGKPLRVGAGAAFGRVNRFLRNMIEAIANAKLRRMERELELRGIRFDRISATRTADNPDRTRVRED